MLFGLQKLLALKVTLVKSPAPNLLNYSRHPHLLGARQRVECIGYGCYLCGIKLWFSQSLTQFQDLIDPMIGR